MAKVNFTYEGMKTVIQCSKGDKMRSICSKFGAKMEVDINSLFFIYNGRLINFELTFNEQANSIDKIRLEMSVIVNKNENETDIKCPKCNHIIKIESIKSLNDLIKFNKNINFSLNELKKQIESIDTNDINQLENKIGIMNYLINDIIKEKEKTKTGVQNLVNTNDNINNNFGLKSDEKTKQLENDLALSSERIKQLEEELQNCLSQNKLNEIQSKKQNKYEMFEKNYKKEYIKYDKFIYLALLSEQCLDFEDMFYFMKRFISMKDDLINFDDSNLFSIACRNYIKYNRESLEIIQRYKYKEKKKTNSEFLAYIIEYEKFVGDEMLYKCQGIIKFIDDNILKKSNYKEYSNELKLFYIKMKADYNKYVAETQHSKKKEFEREAEKCYDEGEILAKKIPISSPYRLGLLLNKSVFLYEVKENHKKAIELVKSTIKEFDKIKNTLNKYEDSSKDSFRLYDLMKENLEIWENEMMIYI